jgi:hypothetical protein
MINDKDTQMDILERLSFDATRCEIQFSKGVATNIEEAAAEIARLRAARDECERQFQEAMQKLSHEIDRTIQLRAAGQRFINWVDHLYSTLPSDKPPGPPRQLLIEMRSVFGVD